MEGKKTMGHEDPDVVVEKPDETVKKNRKLKKMSQESIIGETSSTPGHLDMKVTNLG